MNVVTLKDVTKLYGRFAALRGITHSFQTGAISVILGDNGAGKSTLLRIIAGLTRPSSGAVEVSGTVGYMPHASLLYDELSAIENLHYFAALYGVRDESRLQELLGEVGLSASSTSFAREYSQGMRQRLSLARAIVHDPQILLLDEPFSNVDTQSAGHIARLLSEWRDSGKTILVVTHQPALLEAITDHRLTLTQGTVMADHAAKVRA